MNRSKEDDQIKEGRNKGRRFKNKKKNPKARERKKEEEEGNPEHGIRFKKWG